MDGARVAPLIQWHLVFMVHKLGYWVVQVGWIWATASGPDTTCANLVSLGHGASQNVF